MIQRMTISFSPEERRALDELARTELRPVKDQVRLLVRQEAERRGLWPETTQPRERTPHDQAR